MDHAILDAGLSTKGDVVEVWKFASTSMISTEEAHAK